MLQFTILGLTIRIGMTNVIALPLAVSYSAEMPGDEFPGTELAVMVGPFIFSFAAE